MTFKETITIIAMSIIASLFALFVLIRVLLQRTKNWWRDEVDED